MVARDARTTRTHAGEKPPAVVDNQTTGRLLLSRLIRGINPELRVATCSNAISAMAFMRETTQDLIVTDDLMPEMDGISLIHRVRSMPSCSDAPMIVVTVSSGSARP